MYSCVLTAFNNKRISINQSVNQSPQNIDERRQETKLRRDAINA